MPPCWLFGSGTEMAERWPADRVERWPVAKLVPNAQNARTHSDEQVTQLVASIEEWGWTIPVLVDVEGRNIAGHGRVMAAHRLGIEDAKTSREAKSNRNARFSRIAASIIVSAGSGSFCFVGAAPGSSRAAVASVLSSVSACPFQTPSLPLFTVSTVSTVFDPS